MSSSSWVKLFRNYTDFLNTPSISQKRRCFSPKRSIHYYNNGTYNKVHEPGLDAIPWIRDMTKIRCVIRETLNGIRNLTTTREVGSHNVGTWCRALGENSSSLHNRRFMSQARRTRHFARSVKRVGSSGSEILVKKGAEGKCGNAGLGPPIQTLFETSPSYLQRHQPKPWEERTASKHGQTTQVRPKRYTWSTVCIPEVCGRICQKGILQEERQSKTPGTKQIGWDLIELIRRKLSPTNEKGKRKKENMNLNIVLK